MSTTTLTFTVTDPNGQTASVTLPLTENPAPLTITTTNLPPATVGIPYAYTLAAVGGTKPYTWTLTSGTLPAGLSLSSDGVISGTPV